ncbi:sigma-70 family RNA polymerase sigma factor [Natranaerobius trueperi]|uniref:Flagellar biosynthesis protein FliA n=1 Tax=Natranaerobius trueperi TaxID=759412 RepID=A0A226C0E3_9FIRM|nr:sigma-70 family RNA polymerase sigma factor [Natranaerobius trueperi]OWZ84641.1 hypothetical protein CDO51_02450 [Natranaerobius trueperi]
MNKNDSPKIRQSSLDQVIQNYLDNPTETNLKLVVESSKGLVYHFSKLYSHDCELDNDLVQAGYEGISKAIKKFDTSYKNSFSTFASYYIKGEIQKELTSRTRFKCGGRWMTMLKQQVSKAREELRNNLGKEPSIEDISKKINIDEEAVKIAIIAEIVPMEQIDLNKIKNRHYENFQLAIEDKIALQDALNQLSELQQKVVYYLFYLDLSQTKASKLLGINQRKVSRIKDKALKAISSNLRS